MLIKELIKYGKDTLNKNNVNEADIINKILAKEILNMNRIDLVLNEEKEVDEETKTKYYLALIEIIQGTPVQYITNKQEFYGEEFYVNENVLIPQPDTEILVEEVLNISKEYKENVKILDICTGSGCIGITLSKNIKKASVVMSDVSTKALEVAKKNCNHILKNSNSITLQESNMFENINEKFDIIVSNPPYIETKEIEKLDVQVQKEPKLALDGGEDGLKFYKIIINEAAKSLNKNGYLCLEIGYNQKNAIEKLLKENGKYKNIKCKKDLAGNDRVIIAQINI